MSTRPRRTPHGSGNDSAPALVAVDPTVSSAAGAERAATPQTVPDTALETLPAAGSPGSVVGSVCTGAGGLDLGVLAALGGGRVAWCADPDPHIAQVLAARMPGVPNLGDVRAIDWTAVEPVEVLTAGFPCQDISAAGRRAGIEKGARSGLWTDIVAGVRVLRPALLVVENVAALRWRNGGLHRVLGDLAEAGYDALWRSVRAADIGAAHRRERVFLLAWPRAPRNGRRDGRRNGRCGGDAADADRTRRLIQRHQRHQSAGRPVAAGPAAAVADTDGDQPQRRRGPRDLVGPPGTTPCTEDQRQRDGYAVVDRRPAAPHTDGLGREELHPQDAARWTVAARRGPAAAHTDRGRLPLRGNPDGAHPGASHPDGMCDSHRFGSPAAHTARDRRNQGVSGTARLQGRPDVALGGHAPAGPADHSGHRRRHLVAVPEPASEPARVEVDWGIYESAVRRWEQVLGRRAPFPTQPGRHGRPVLAPAFVEWLQGLEPGWVTGLPLPRTAQLRALGNGVVPQQAAYAVGLLLADLAALLSTAANADTTTPGERRGHRQEADAA